MRLAAEILIRIYQWTISPMLGVSGGRVTMLTAPNPKAQAELLSEAYDKAQIDPTTIGYIECHGTGTSLGDPIEIQALKKAFADLYRKHGKLAPAQPHCGQWTAPFAGGAMP